MSEGKNVSFKKKYDYVFGGIFPEHKNSVILNKENSEVNSLYPTYNEQIINQVLKVRSKMYIAEQLNCLKQFEIIQDNVKFIHWCNSSKPPILVPYEFTEFVKNMSDGDYGFPIMFESLNASVAQQPVSVWIMIPTISESFEHAALSELTRWIGTSEKWWRNNSEKAQDKNKKSILDNTRRSLLRN